MQTFLPEEFYAYAEPFQHQALSIEGKEDAHSARVSQRAIDCHQWGKCRDRGMEWRGPTQLPLRTRQEFLNLSQNGAFSLSIEVWISNPEAPH
jgi:hypothetical protein